MRARRRVVSSQRASPPGNEANGNVQPTPRGKRRQRRRWYALEGANRTRTRHSTGKRWRRGSAHIVPFCALPRAQPDAAHEQLARDVRLDNDGRRRGGRVADKGPGKQSHGSGKRLLSCGAFVTHPLLQLIVEGKHVEQDQGYVNRLETWPHSRLAIPTRSGKRRCRGKRRPSPQTRRWTPSFSRAFPPLSRAPYSDQPCR